MINEYRTRRLRRAAGSCAVLVGLVLSFLPGCKDDGPSELELWKKRQEDAAKPLIDAGAKATKHNYGQGQAWSLDLNGVQVTDEMLNRLKRLGQISDLNLSGSNITDDQMAIINEPEIGAMLGKLTLSHTAISDA